MKSEQSVNFKPSFFIKLFIGYVYFMQGIYLSIISVVVYLYPIFPSPDVIAEFTKAALPFSFKFLTAPLVEKLTIKTYGRRKFWIVISLFIKSILTYPLALVANSQEDYKTTVAILFAIMLFVSVGDVAIDASSVIELEDPVLAGYLQAGMQPLGNVVGSFLILKAINPTFWLFIGIQGILCTTQTLLTIISVIGFLVAAIVHFCYKERVPEEQTDQKPPEFKTIAKYYLHFVKPKYTLCRHVIYFLLVNQGLKFFRYTFSLEAIYRGFPKQQIADMGNICIIVGLVINTIIRKFISKNNCYQFLAYAYFTQLVLYTVIFYLNSFDQTVVYCSIFCMNILGYIKFLLQSTIINGFAHSQFPGLCLTTLASFLNLGYNGWLQLKLHEEYGYSSSVTGGLIYAWILALGLTKFLDWVRSGQPEFITHEKQN